MNSNTTMTFSDEQLSAFLDGELAENEMETIRQQLSIDEQLADRIAELAMVDEVVVNAYDVINSQPLPTSLDRLLNSIPEPESDASNAKVLHFPGGKKGQKPFKQHLALAASIALVAGFSLAQLISQDNNPVQKQWQQIVAFLDNTPSGRAEMLVNGAQLKPKLTFINQQGQFCRQYQIIEQNMQQDSIACRIDNQWQLAASFYQTVSSSEMYQTASAGGLIRSSIEQMADGDFFDKQAEQRIINQHWQAK